MGKFLNWLLLGQTPDTQETNNELAEYEAVYELPDEYRAEETQLTPQVDDVLLQALIDGETITREKALTLPAVSGAVDFISNSIASMPVKLYKYKDGKVEEQEKDTRVKLLNGDTGDTLYAFQMKKAIVEDYLLGNGGYCYIQRNRNEVTGLFYVEERFITILRAWHPIFKDYKILVVGDEYYPWDFVKLLRNTKDGASGIGVTDEVSKALETAYSTLLYQLNLVQGGGNKKGFLKSQRKLGQDEINVLKQAWRNLYSNSTENVVVLNNGLEFQEARNSSVENQINESRKTLMEEINGLFHITNDFDLTFKLAIYPIVKAFETALNRDLLLEKEKKNHFFEFDVKEIIRASLRERYEAYKLAKETGFMTLNEIRRAENMDYIEGLDVVNVGLGAVLYDTNTHQYYTPNTDTAAMLGTQKMIEGHVLTEEFDASGNSSARADGKTYAVDFDNTLANGGIVDNAAIAKVKALQDQGARIVLWTARTGEDLQNAIDQCKAKGLIFDEVAKDKPNADFFIDDKAATIEALRG